MNKKLKLIVNPQAGRAKTKMKWPKISKQLTSILGEFSFDFTQQMNHATEMAQTAIREGFETVVAVGGDGTINEVINGFFESGNQINPNVKLGIIPMGTGGDWIRTLGIPKTVEASSQVIKRGHAVKSDVGLLECNSLSGGKVSRYFINVSDAGFGGTLIYLSHHSTKFLNPFLTYLMALLKTLKKHKEAVIRIEIDESIVKEQLIKAVVVANGKFFGGGMRIAPQAIKDDGLFDIIIIENLSPVEIITNLNKLYNGKLMHHHKVQSLRGKTITLNSKAEVLIEADGEIAGKLPASYRLLPSTINVIC